MPEIGSWGGLQVRLTLPEVNNVLEPLNGALEIVNAGLEIGLSTLEIVKTFTIPTLNPTKAILDELIALCQGTLIDLRKAGLYAHLGDFGAIASGDPLSSLKGGYDGFQRRMIARLTDRRDLRRPEFNGNTTVLGVFVYTGVDVSFVDGILDTTKFQSLRRTGQAFGQLLGISGVSGRNTSLPTPSNLAVTYPLAPQASGSDPSSYLRLIAATSQMVGRNTAIVSWTLPSNTGNGNPIPTIPPAGFIVEVSCFPEGFYAGWISPTASTTGGVGGGGSSDGHQSYETGTYKEGTTGQTLRVMGGADSIHLDPGVVWDSCFDGTEIRTGARPAFFFRDPSVPETLHNPFPKEGDVYFNQKTFFVSREAINLQALVGGTYTLEITQNDLPLYAPIKEDGTVDTHNAVAPREVYVRVTAVNDTVTESNFRSLQWDLKPRTSADREQVGLVSPFTLDAKGTPSEIVKVTFPSTETNLYTTALQTALGIVLLSRSDVQPADPVTHGPPPEDEPTVGTPLYVYEPTGLEGPGRDLIPLVESNPQRFFGLRGNSPDSFTRDLYAKVVSLADQILAGQGNLPPALLRARADSFNRLINWRWSDTTVEGASGNSSISQTILESMCISRVDANTTVLCRNIYGLPGYWRDMGIAVPLSMELQARDDFARSSFGDVPDGFSSAPMVCDISAKKAWYVRDLIPPEIYTLAAEVLGITTSRVRPGGWMAWRPLVGVGPLAANGRVLGMVEGFLGSLAAGTESVESGILRTISFLEQRVAEVQETLGKIREYLDLPFQISIPDAVVLPVLATGTDGVVSALVASESKPADGPQAYSAGMVILGGGLPSILIDLLLLLLGS